MGGPFSIIFSASPTFLTQTIPFVFGATSGLIAAFVLLARLVSRHRVRSELRSLHRDIRGVAAIMDFTLVLPIFVMIILLTLQLALMANASILVHYSAYSAARAAKTHLVDFDHAFLDLDCCSVNVANKAIGVMEALSILNGGGGDASERIFAAAAWPLVSLAPSSSAISVNSSGAGQNSSRSSFDRINDLDLRSLLRKQAISAGRTNLLIKKASYAFSSAYLQVDYGSPIFNTVSELWQQQSSSPSAAQIASSLGANAKYAAIAMNLAKQLQSSSYSITTITSLPVYAEVQFYFPLLVPWAGALFEQSNSMANNPGRWMSAKVELL